MPIVGDVLVDRYRIEGVLGAGGMASVYRATDLRLDREVAVKVLLPNLARDPSVAGRFEREARMLAAVAHPNIAAVFDVDPGDPESGREPFYVMELCEGGSLADQIEADGLINPDDLVPTIAAIADGLAELHRRGLIHRDVKPANILFAGGRPRLADFGITSADGPTDLTTFTAPGTMMGTPAYLAPELLVGGTPTVATDTYALGATTFHALTGQPPKPAESLEEMIAARSTPAPTVSSVAPGIGAAFDAPVASALGAAAGERPVPTEFAASLEQALQSWRTGSDGGSRADQLAETVVDIPIAAASPAAASTAVTAPAPFSAPAAPESIPVAPSAGAASAAAPATRRAARVDAASPRTAGGLPVVAVAGLVAIILAIGVLVASGGIDLVPPPPGSPTRSVPATAPPATENAGAAALGALDAVVAAIEQARGGRDGLNGNEANDLQALANDVGGALRAGDFAAARSAAGRLAERADELDDKLDDAHGDALHDAIDHLRATIPTG